MMAQIKQACPADWEQMKIGLNSRHCEQCDKAVIDFTEMSREDMVKYLIENSDQRTCGRMRQSQFDFQFDDMPVIVESLRRKGGNVAFLMMALLCASLLSCSHDTPACIKPPKESSHTHGDMEMVMGKIDMNPDTNKTESDQVTAEIPPVVYVDPGPDPEPEPIIQGEVIVDPEPPKSEGELKTEPEILSYAEKMPEFPGGMEELQLFIQKNLVYPQYAKEAGIEGTIYIRFVVDKEGKISNPTILKSVADGKILDKETIRLVKSMPKWIPGEQNGKKVDVYFTMPVRFRLK